MKLRIVPYKMNSKSARLLASKLTEKLGYKVWRGRAKEGWLNLNWGTSKKTFVEFNGWINPPISVSIARDKRNTFGALSAAGVSHVPYTTTKEEAAKWLEAGKVVFARTAGGQAGSGITVVQPGEALPEAPLYTQYVKKKKEFRIHVFNGQAIFIQEKRKANGVEADPLIRSHKRGWKFCIQDIVEPDGLRELGVAAVSACGLNFGAVDIIWNEHYNKLYVLEINSAPGIEESSLGAYVDAVCSFVR